MDDAQAGAAMDDLAAKRDDLTGTPADIDLAVLKGVNYPKGLLAWGDAMGLDHVLTRLTALEQEYGEDRYRPSALLKRMVREGRRFT